MVSGDNARRNLTIPIPDPPQSEWTSEDKTQDALSQKALGFNCLDNFHRVSGPEKSLGRHYLPDKSWIEANCPDGMRFELMFPSCWNGRDLDSVDHKSHLAFPDLVLGGICPTGYPYRIPSLYYELVWDTMAFQTEAGQFYLANGDPTGTSYHGDFFTGWDAEVLSTASQVCTDPTGQIQNCEAVTVAAPSLSATCQLVIPEALQSEDYVGPREGLPGLPSSPAR